MSETKSIPISGVGFGPPTRICVICQTREDPTATLAQEGCWICEDCTRKLRELMGLCPECGGEGSFCGYGTRVTPDGRAVGYKHTAYVCKRCGKQFEMEGYRE